MVIATMQSIDAQILWRVFIIHGTSLLLFIKFGLTWLNPVTPLIIHPPKGALDQSGYLVCSAVDGLFQGCCLVSYRNGLAAFESGFHYAPHGVGTDLFIAVFIAQVDLYPRDVIAKAAQGMLSFVSDISGQRLVTIYGMTCIDLNLHGVLPSGSAS